MLGYGSSQILHLTDSICRLMNSSGVICQPLLPQRKFIEVVQAGLTVETISTASHPFSGVGRREYLTKCLEVVNRVRPDVLLITNYILFELLEGLNYKPKRVIHLALEDLQPIIDAGFGAGRIAKLRQLTPRVDLWIFPESNRAIHDARLLGITQDRISIFYNTAESAHAHLDTPKNNRIIYAGTLDVETSVGGFIFDRELAHFPLDVYGDLQGARQSVTEMAKKISVMKKMGGGACSVRWHGQIPKDALDKLMPAYNFSVIYWRPVRHALLNAAPNKFFQAVGAGVPVISAPHPQPKMFIERYGCGVLLDGWDKKHLLSGLHQAERLMHSSAYEEMKRNCYHAVATELSWDRQMSKFATRFNVKDW